jgi:hypothetical protein
MPNQIFVHVSQKTYMQRIKPLLIGPLLFAGFIIAIGYLGTGSLWTLPAGLLLFAFYFLERLYWGRYYIIDIEELADERLKITYMDKNELKEYTGDKKSMHIQRGSVWYKMKADKELYLIFKDEQKGFSLKQFALGDWEDAFINQFIIDWQQMPDRPKMIA